MRSPGTAAGIFQRCSESVTVQLDVLLSRYWMIPAETIGVSLSNEKSTEPRTDSIQRTNPNPRSGMRVMSTQRERQQQEVEFQVDKIEEEANRVRMVNDYCSRCESGLLMIRVPLFYPCIIYGEMLFL